jgi:hypothetical protein
MGCWMLFFDLPGFSEIVLSYIVWWEVSNAIQDR